jgi:hypothetical protein
MVIFIITVMRTSCLASKAGGLCVFHASSLKTNKFVYTISKSWCNKDMAHDIRNIVCGYQYRYVAGNIVKPLKGLVL